MTSEFVLGRNDAVAISWPPYNPSTSLLPTQFTGVPCGSSSRACMRLCGAGTAARSVAETSPSRCLRPKSAMQNSILRTINCFGAPGSPVHLLGHRASSRRDDHLFYESYSPPPPGASFADHSRHALGPSKTPESIPPVPEMSTFRLSSVNVAHNRRGATNESGQWQQ